MRVLWFIGSVVCVTVMGTMILNRDTKVLAQTQTKTAVVMSCGAWDQTFNVSRFSAGSLVPTGIIIPSTDPGNPSDGTPCGVALQKLLNGGLTISSVSGDAFQSVYTLVK
jgi:hypothetical protein